MKTTRHLALRRVLKWTALGCGLLVALVAVALCAVTWWLTPARLTRLVNTQASQALEADVRASDIRFTFWSTFPRLMVEADSLHVRSRTLDSVAPDIKGKLPHDADFLASTGHIAGGINILSLLRGEIALRDIEVEGLRVNLLAVNDSLNNFDITSGAAPGRVPRFHIAGLKLTHGGLITFRSIPADTEASVALTEGLIQPEGGADRYRLAIGGRLSAVSDGLHIFHDFPFALGGKVAVRFDPFGVSTTGYEVSLGSVRGHMDLSLEAGDRAGINKFEYRISRLDIAALLPFLPVEWTQQLGALHADLSLEASARLTSPYRFSSPWLPSVEIDFRVPSGRLSYALADGREVEADRVALEGRFLYDGRDPAASRVVVPRIEAAGYGAEILASATVDDLTTRPRIAADISAAGDLKELTPWMPALKQYAPAGHVGLDAAMQLVIDGQDLSGTLTRFDLRSPSLAMNAGGGRLSVRDLTLSSAPVMAPGFDREALLTQVPVTLKVKASSLRYADPADTLDLRTGRLNLTASVDTRTRGPLTRRLTLRTGARSVSLVTASTDMRLDSLRVDFSAAHRARPLMAKAFDVPQAWTHDAALLERIPHTPELIDVNLPASLSAMLADWDARLRVRVPSGSLRADGYHGRNALRGLDLTVTGDSARLAPLWIRSGSTAGRVSLVASNLRQFLCTPGPAPLDFQVNADFDTLQLNQLARFYAIANPASAIARGDGEAMVQGDNNTTFLLPRNLRSHIRARAAAVRYINLRLYGLCTEMDLGGGDLDIDTLGLSASFAKLGVACSLKTSDVEALRLNLGLGLDSLDVVGFCANFPDLVKDMPTLANLSGALAAHIQARAMVFPDMCVNMPSVWADARLDALDIALVQDPVVRHVTRMLLLPDETLRFADIRIHAGVHDNLLEVYPFDFAVDRYRLVIQGLNNFDGDIYYHVGVDKWPLHLPFGVNVKGSYHKPQFRFGGKDWHDRNGAGITAGVEDYDRLNVMKAFKRYGGELVHTAAAYRGPGAE